ncbi:MAG: lysozyme [Proteobacteria bacterium]|nr:lysozyme [Pseudomonadota bacterium]
MRNTVLAAILLLALSAGALSVIWEPERFMYAVVYKVKLFGLRSPEAKAIYDSYSKHFYASYIKTLTKEEAQYYADYYADYYANYYTSEGYKTSLQYALPEDTAENRAFPQSDISAFRLNAKGVAIITYFEGFQAEPYLDAGGKLTIGYGHLIRQGEFFDKVDENQARVLLAKDIALAEAVVKKNVKVPLTKNQFSALVSLVYNIGPKHFEESTLLKLLNQRDYNGASLEFVRWKHVGQKELRGLLKRRKVETALFVLQEA